MIELRFKTYSNSDDLAAIKYVNIIPRVDEVVEIESKVYEVRRVRWKFIDESRIQVICLVVQI